MQIGTGNFAKHDERFPYQYRAKVLDNVDPSKFGRIKAQVCPMFAKITDATLLPWCVPAHPIGIGAGVGTGTFTVPDIGSWVWVFFEMGDIYQPVYFASAPTALSGLPANKDTDYPETSIFKTASGVEFLLDRKAGSDHIKLTMPSGATAEILPDGNIIITTVKEGANVSVLVAKGNINLEATAGEVNIIGGGSVNIQAPETVVDGNLRVGTGDSGSIVTGSGQVIEVADGIIIGGLI